MPSFLHDDAPAARLAQAVLLFHRPGPWDDAARQAWRDLAGADEATTRTLCDLAQRTLGLELAIGNDESPPPAPGGPAAGFAATHNGED